MDPRKYALYGGIVMLALGALALIPSMVGSTIGLPPLYLDTSYGHFMGYFSMNIVNKLALIAFGVSGIAVASLKFNALPRSILWSKIVFVVMGLAAILGAIPATSTLYGYWPLFGNEVLLHAFFAVLGAYFGFALGIKVQKEIKTNPNLRETFQVSRIGR